MSVLIGGQRPEIRSPDAGNKWESAEFAGTGVMTSEDARNAASRGLKDYYKALSERDTSDPVVAKAVACYALCVKALEGDGYAAGIQAVADTTGIVLDSNAMGPEASDVKHTGTKTYTPPKLQL